MKVSEARNGQLKYHWEKVELIREHNTKLADKITEFTELLIEKDFKGAFSVDDDVYHNGVGISQSRWQWLKKSPFNYWYNTYINVMSNAKRPKHFVDGDFIHRIVLERETVNERFVNEDVVMRLAWEANPEAKKIRATKTYKEAVANYRLDGREVIASEMFNSVKYLDEYFKEEPILNNLMGNGIAEKAFYSICPHTGLIRKAKADFITPTDDGKIHIVDLKSSKDIGQREFDWSIANYDYHVQGGYYFNVIGDAIDKEIKDYLMLLIEKSAPFELDLRFMDEPSLEVGERDSLKYLHILAECYRSGMFPRKKLNISSCGLPASRMSDELIQL